MRSMHKTKKTTTTIKIEAISQNGWKLSMWVTGNQKKKRKKEMMENVKIGYLMNCIALSLGQILLSPSSWDTSCGN